MFCPRTSCHLHLIPRMQRLSRGDHAGDSFANLLGSGGSSSLWFSTKQPQICFSASRESEPKSSMKLSYQEHDSSPTTLSSTGQSWQNGAIMPGFSNTYKGGKDCISQLVQMEHPPPMGCVSYPYFGKKETPTAYGQNAPGYSQSMGITPARGVLPLDIIEGAPIYVNAKQYHAILRRRQNRAKLEARNKVAKSRKPYLHESRHLHALRRARGSGGRFLNTKNKKQSTNPSSKTHNNNNNNDPINSWKINRNDDNMIGACEPKRHHTWGSSPSGSDVSGIFSNEDIFEQPDLRMSMSISGLTSYG